MKIRAHQIVIASLFAIALILCVWIAAPSDRSQQNSRIAATPAAETGNDTVGFGVPAGAPQPISAIARNGEFDRYIELARVDVRAAFDRIAREIPTQSQSEYRIRLASALLKEGFANAPAILECLRSAKERQTAMAEAIPIAFPKDRASVKATVQKLTGDARSSGLYYITNSELVAGDLAAAVQTQLAMPYSDARTSTLLPVAGSLANKREVGLALQWLMQLQPSDERPLAVRRLREEWTKAGYSDGLLRLLDAHMPQSEREAIVGALSDLELASGGDGTLSHKGIEMTVREKEQLIHRKLMADQSTPFEGKLELATKLSDPKLKDGLIFAIVRRESELNPQEVATKVMQLPSSARNQSLNTLVVTWAQADVEQVADWVQRLPSTPEKDTAIESLALAIRFKDPQAAKVVASWMKDNQRRASILKNIR